MRGWVDPRAVMNDMEKWKFLTLPGLELRSFCHLARRQSLYQLRYRDSNDYSRTNNNNNNNNNSNNLFKCRQYMSKKCWNVSLYATPMHARSHPIGFETGVFYVVRAQATFRQLESRSHPKSWKWKCSLHWTRRGPTQKIGLNLAAVTCTTLQVTRLSL
jgi:hypothetical protein